MMENDYISRAELENWLLNESACLDTDEDKACVIERLRKAIPAADVRLVVCCKDCVHWRPDPATKRMCCWIWNWINSSTGEDYCSFAEKRGADMAGGADG